MAPLVWCILLFALGLALIFLELFLPSGGVLSFLAFAAVLASIVLAYYNVGMGTGTTFLAVTVFAVPALIALALKWWPNTPLGRMILNTPKEDETFGETEHTRHLKSLRGKQGKAKSLMLPSGVVEIEGHTYDAVSRTGAIDPGQNIEVIDTSGYRVVVRAIDRAAPDGDRTEPETPDTYDPMVEDPFNDPLG